MAAACRRGLSRSQHLAAGFRHAYVPGAHGIGIVWSDIGVLAIWAVIGATVAILRFSWLPKTAGA